MHEALYYNRLGDDRVKCRLCPQECVIKHGNLGHCRVRKNENAVLYSENYGKVCSIRFDPIEKKPLYHFKPGSLILSVGNIGCNLHCKFCQNYEISQSGLTEYRHCKEYTPEAVVEHASGHAENAGIAYTYNEPTVWYEYMFDIAKEAKQHGLSNVVVTNGYINKEPLLKLLPFMDAFNVDLKAFSEKFYKSTTSATLEPVKNTIKIISDNQKHLEITNLVITGLNDNEAEFEEMVKWIATETGEETPFHISRYFPVYKLENKATSVKTMLHFFDIARKYLKYVYLGNVSTEKGNTTFCPNCGKPVIERKGYTTYKTGLKHNGHCKYCGYEVIKWC